MLSAIVTGDRNHGTTATYRNMFSMKNKEHLVDNPDLDMFDRQRHGLDEDLYSEQSGDKKQSQLLGNLVNRPGSAGVNKDLGASQKKDIGGMGEISKFLFKSGRDTVKENYTKIKQLEFLYYQQLLNTVLQCSLAIISMISAIVEYEIDYNGVGGTDEKNLALWFCFITSVLLWVTIIFEYLINCKTLSLTKNLPERLWKTERGNLLQLVATLLFFFIHPNPIFSGVKVKIYNDKLQVFKTHTVNSIFTMICLLRMWYILKLYLVYSKYYSPRSQRVSKMNNFDTNLEFSLKALMYKSPVTTYLLLFCLILAYTSFCLRMFERVLDVESGLNFSSYWNNLWCLVITMTTVGYGDFYPSSTLGRMIGIIAGICGIFLISMLIVTITNVLLFKDVEFNVFLILKRVYIKEEKDRLATDLVVKYFRYLKKLKKDPHSATDKTKSKWRDQLMLCLYYFSEKCQELDNTFPAYSKFDNLVDILKILMDEKMAVVENKYIDLENQLMKMLEKLS
jgi:hypothetical protein